MRYRPRVIRNDSAARYVVLHGLAMRSYWNRAPKTSCSSIFSHLIARRPPRAIIFEKLAFNSSTVRSGATRGRRRTEKGIRLQVHRLLSRSQRWRITCSSTLRWIHFTTDCGSVRRRLTVKVSYPSLLKFARCNGLYFIVMHPKITLSHWLSQTILFSIRDIFRVKSARRSTV